MNGKLTPKESFVLYGGFIVLAFALFLLGLYWGRSQVTGLNQEITAQPVGSALRSAPRTESQTRLDLPARDVDPAPPDQTSNLPAPPSPGPGPVSASTPLTSALPPAAQPSTAAKAAVSGATKGLFSIQVGAFKTEEEARKVIVRLQSRGYTGILDKPSSQRDPFYRVRAGSYETREAAVRAEALLKEEGFLTFIKKMN